MLLQGKSAMEAVAVHSATLLLQLPQAAIRHLPRVLTPLPTRRTPALTTAAQTRVDRTLEAQTRAGQTPAEMAGAPRSHPGSHPLPALAQALALHTMNHVMPLPRLHLEAEGYALTSRLQASFLSMLQ